MCHPFVQVEGAADHHNEDVLLPAHDGSHSAFSRTDKVCAYVMICLENGISHKLGPVSSIMNTFFFKENIFEHIMAHDVSDIDRT